MRTAGATSTTSASWSRPTSWSHWLPIPNSRSWTAGRDPGPAAWGSRSTCATLTICLSSSAATATDGRAAGRLALREVRGGELPVDQVLEPGLDVCRPGVLEVEVVGVLPDVEREQRGLAVLERQVGVLGLEYLEAVFAPRQPGPTRAEQGLGLVGEGLLEVVDRPERLLERRADVAVGIAAAAGSHAAPEERVVPGLRGVVEHRTGFGGKDDLLERLVGVVGAVDELVEGVDIGLVVLAVVEVERLLAHVGRESVLAIRQRGQLEGHRHSLRLVGGRTDGSRLSLAGGAPVGGGARAVAPFKASPRRWADDLPEVIDVEPGFRV